jgi:hypothetical protein
MHVLTGAPYYVKLNVRDDVLRDADDTSKYFAVCDLVGTMLSTVYSLILKNK